MEKRIILGSGKLYIAAWSGTMPTDTVIETDANLIGLISGGATISYEPEFKTVKDDLGLVTKQFLTEEEVKLTSGVLTWNGKTLEKLCSTARVTETEDLRTVKIGGIDNYDSSNYCIRFVHEAEEGTVRVTIVGKNEAGFEIAFSKDDETVIDAEFIASPCDDEGTLVIYSEEL